MQKTFGIVGAIILLIATFFLGRYTGGGGSDTAGPTDADGLGAELAAERDRLGRDAELNRGVAESLGKREAGIVQREAILADREGILDRREIELGNRQGRLDREGAIADREGSRIADDAGTVAEADEWLRKALEELGEKP